MVLSRHIKARTSMRRSDTLSEAIEAAGSSDTCAAAKGERTLGVIYPGQSRNINSPIDGANDERVTVSRALARGLEQ
jgi:hypothetical protein